MNTDFRVAVSFTQHPKTKKLIRKLGYKAFYSLINLWSFVSMNKPDGIMTNMDVDDIEIASDWNGECSKFVLALLEHKFIDKIDGVYNIHDWKDHNGYAFYSPQRSEKAKNAAKARWNKKNKNNKLMLSDANSISQASASNAPTPTPTPTPTPKSKEHTAFDNAEFYITKKKRKITGKRLETFMLFWEAFDYKRGKAEATDVWIDLQLTNNIMDKIIIAAKAEAKRRPNLKANGGKPKMAQGWLSGKRWEDEIQKQEPKKQYIED